MDTPLRTCVERALGRAVHDVHDLGAGALQVVERCARQPHAPLCLVMQWVCEDHSVSADEARAWERMLRGCWLCGLHTVGDMRMHMWLWHREQEACACAEQLLEGCMQQDGGCVEYST